MQEDKVKIIEKLIKDMQEEHKLSNDIVLRVSHLSDAFIEHLELHFPGLAPYINKYDIKMEWDIDNSISTLFTAIITPDISEEITVIKRYTLTTIHNSL